MHRAEWESNPGPRAHGAGRDRRDRGGPVPGTDEAHGARMRACGPYAASLRLTRGPRAEDVQMMTSPSAASRWGLDPDPARRGTASGESLVADLHDATLAAQRRRPRLAAQEVARGPSLGEIIVRLLKRK